MVSGARPSTAVEMRAEVTPGEWREFQFRQPFKIGRLKECGIAIDNSFVSRVHAEVVYENGSWWIRDLGSANGLFLSGARVPSVPIVDLTVADSGIEGPEL